MISSKDSSVDGDVFDYGAMWLKLRGRFESLLELLGVVSDVRAEFRSEFVKVLVQ